MRTISEISDYLPLTDWFSTDDEFDRDRRVIERPEQVFRFASSYAQARLLTLEPTNASEHE